MDRNSSEDRAAFYTDRAMEARSAADNSVALESRLAFLKLADAWTKLAVIASRKPNAAVERAQDRDPRNRAKS